MPAAFPAGVLCTAAVVAVAGLVGDRVPGAVLLAVAVVAGLPHGAFDFDVARVRFGNSTPCWWVPFLSRYLGLLVASLALWWIAPVAALLLFLLLSAAHFGLQDAAPGASRLPRVIAHGGVPVVFSALFHPAAFRGIVSILIGDHALALQRLLAGPLAAAWLLAAMVTLAGYAHDGRPAARGHAIDLLLIGTLFAWAPPLVAFAAYFALIHTPRAFADLGERLPDRGAAAWRAALLTAVALLLGLAIFVANRGEPVADGVVRTAFVLLGALTVPHMWLELGGRGRQRPNGVRAVGGSAGARSPA